MRAFSSVLGALLCTLAVPCTAIANESNESNESGNIARPDNITYPVAGVYVNGTLHERADILGGLYVFEQPAAYIVTVSDKNATADLLQMMLDELTWTPALNFVSLPMFTGVLNHEQIVWLLQRQEVVSIESDDIVSIDGEGSERIDEEGSATNGSEAQGNESAAGVNVNGTLYKTADILSGLYVFEEPGVYIVGVSDKNATADLLETMLQELAWTPSKVFSSLPMFWGTLDHEQIVWLLGRQEVMFIETDGIVSIATKDLTANDSQVGDDRPISASVHASSQGAALTLLLGFGLFIGRGGL